ncbi:MAG: hypothetical protein KF727_06595 [Microbacteriaceae bacterium]|nr:hypothetical protein [Microbacteriaceae bacterium]
MAPLAEVQWVSLHGTAWAEPHRAAPIVEWPDDLRAEMESLWEAIINPETWRTPPVLQATTRER